MTEFEERQLFVLNAILDRLGSIERLLRERKKEEISPIPPKEERKREKYILSSSLTSPNNHTSVTNPKRRTRIPADFALTPERTSYAHKQGVNPQAEMISFREYYDAKGTVWLDWDKVWQQWCRRSAERQRNGGVYAPRPRDPDYWEGPPMAPK